MAVCWWDQGGLGIATITDPVVRRWLENTFQEVATAGENPETTNSIGWGAEGTASP